MIDKLDSNVNVFDPSIDVNALGQAIDTTWGRTSTPRAASYSVKFSIVGGFLQASYAAIVNFASEREMIMMKRRYAEESDSILKNLLSEIKKNYKDLSGKTLKIKEAKRSDSVEVISNSFHSLKRTAYYRCLFQFEISG
jgi:hypothetical protein